MGRMSQLDQFQSPGQQLRLFKVAVTILLPFPTDMGRTLEAYSLLKEKCRV